MRTLFLSVLCLALILFSACSRQAASRPERSASAFDERFVDGVIFRYTEYGFETVRLGKISLDQEMRSVVVLTDRRGNYYIMIAGRLSAAGCDQLSRRLPKEGNWRLTTGEICPHPVYRPDEIFPVTCFSFTAAGTRDDQLIARERNVSRLGIMNLDAQYAKQ